MKPDRATKPIEIEITPKMIEAGVDVFSHTLGAAVNCTWVPRDLAKQVYLAMYLCSAEPHQ